MEISLEGVVTTTPLVCTRDKVDPICRYTPFFWLVAIDAVVVTQHRGQSPYLSG